ncbi:MAG: MCE family protein [Patulibacter sp.]|nr:MCE family protein [Patulibacter sp.]
MKRRSLVAGLAAILLLAIAVTAVASGGDDRDGKYRVRVIFDSAAFVIPGSNVKIAGVVVGTVGDVELTEKNQAAVTIEITDPGYQDFRTDATCRVGLQSLIGEQFIECKPTQPRADGAPEAPRLSTIEDGPGKGDYLLPVERTSVPVGPDLIGNIMRVPEQERFRLILNEFGAAVAGNGGALREAIHRANPTLRQANEFVEILAQQNELIARLTDQSDEILEPLAQKRGDLAGFIRTAGETAAAAEEEGDALEQNFAKFPAFLRELKPATERISDLADQVGPSIANLSAQAPALNRAVTGFGPFVKASGPALETLGDAAERGQQTFPRIEPLVDRFGQLADNLAPVTRDLSDLGSSFDQTGGIENLVRLVYYYTGAMNGKDGTSHYLRSRGIATQCVERANNRSGFAGTSLCDGTLRTLERPSESGSERSVSRSATLSNETSSESNKRIESLLGPEPEAKP